MHDLDRSILATLAYYASFGWPLTPIEIHGRLIPASRLGGRTQSYALSEVAERVNVLCAIGRIRQESGLYTLATMSEGFGEQRIEQEKIWAQKWRSMRRKAFWLQAVPYVRALCASGSMALGNTSVESDWDIFAIVSVGRLYTARSGLLLAAKVMGVLRTKHDAHAPDAFCFNHYVTTTGLAIRHRSLYVAHGLGLLVPITESRGYLERLWQANQWIGDFRPMPGNVEYIRRSVKYSSILGTIQRVGEFILNTWIGGLLEKVLRRWQQGRIQREPATHASGGRIVANDRELEFHPRSFEGTALNRYHAHLESLGLGAYREVDSGLTK